MGQKCLKNILILLQILYFLPKYKFNKYADKHIYLNIYYIILEYIKILNADFLYLRDICKKKVYKYSQL